MNSSYGGAQRLEADAYSQGLQKKALTVPTPTVECTHTYARNGALLWTFSGKNVEKTLRQATFIITVM